MSLEKELEIVLKIPSDFDRKLLNTALVWAQQRMFYVASNPEGRAATYNILHTLKKKYEEALNNKSVTPTGMGHYKR